jgi:hypothetical protein
VLSMHLRITAEAATGCGALRCGLPPGWAAARHQRLVRLGAGGRPALVRLYSVRASCARPSACSGCRTNVSISTSAYQPVLYSLCVV